jgi:hypothetical protein
MECLSVYVLTKLFIDAKGEIVCKNLGVTFDIFEAEAHKALGVENDLDTFPLARDWRENSEQSSLITVMRELRVLVQQIQDAALR